MKLKSIISYFILLSAIAHGQPAIEWQHAFGGSDFDSPQQTLVLPDNEYVVAGMSYSPVSGDKSEGVSGERDMWVVKFNASGEILWQNTIGGDDRDSATAIIALEDGFLVAGNSESGISGDKTEESRGNVDFWIVKLNSDGEVEWDKTIGGSSVDALANVEQTEDGGFILGGHSASNISGEKTDICRGVQPDYWIVKIDAEGTIEWQKTIGGEGNDMLFDIHQTADGGYILGGVSSSGIGWEKTEESRGNNDYWIIKTDAAGVLEWQKTIGGEETDFFTDLVVAHDGGYLAGGYSGSDISGDKTEDSRGSFDYWVVKLSDEGIIEWQRTIGGDDGDYLYSVANTHDNGFLLAGMSPSGISGDKSENSRGSGDYWIIKLNSEASIAWQKTLGGDSGDTAYSIFEDNDKGIVITGYSHSGVSGDKMEESQGEADFWIVKLAPETAGLIDNSSFASLYPNPSTGSVNITLKGNYSGMVKVYDVTGKLITEKEFTSVFDMQFDLPFDSGVYLVEVTSGKSRETFKVVKI